MILNRLLVALCVSVVDRALKSSAALCRYNPHPAADQIVTVAEALRGRLGADALDVVVDTHSTAGIEAAVNASKKADLVVVVIGDTAGSCGESDDRMELDVNPRYAMTPRDL